MKNATDEDDFEALNNPFVINTVSKDDLKALKHEMMRKENALFDLMKENLKLQNEKLKLEIYGLKRG